MARAHFNEPVIVGHEVARCIGYGEDAIDCYIIVQYAGSACASGRVVWHTCVGGYTFLDRLKGQDYVKANNGEDWDDLTRLCSSLSFNGAPKADQFLVVIRPDDSED